MKDIKLNSFKLLSFIQAVGHLNNSQELSIEQFPQSIGRVKLFTMIVKDKSITVEIENGLVTLIDKDKEIISGGFKLKLTTEDSTGILNIYFKNNGTVSFLSQGKDLTIGKYLADFIIENFKGE